MATYCTQIDNKKKARALQIQGSGLHRSTQKCWNFRLKPNQLLVGMFRGLKTARGDNPGCSRVPGPTKKRAHAHQGSNDLCASDVRTIYSRIGTCFMPRGSVTPVG